VSLVVVNGDFSSGTTLLFTLFRNVEGCHCLYEPLHELLPQYLVWPPRQYEGHAFVGDYFREDKGYDAIPRLFDPSWGVSGLSLEPDAQAPALHRYLTYLIGTSYARAPRVVLKDNRFAFRLGWLRRHFPDARVVNVYRDLDDQWRSWVRRAQEYAGREDVGQDSVAFMGFRLAAWCDDLAAAYPELAAERSSSGYERFSKLWTLSRREHERHADVCVNLLELHDDFDGALRRISAAVGFSLDPGSLRSLVASERRAGQQVKERSRGMRLVDRAGMRYAEARVQRQRRQNRDTNPGTANGNE
jgi:hypothetical protein